MIIEDSFLKDMNYFKAICQGQYLPNNWGQLVEGQQFFQNHALDVSAFMATSCTKMHYSQYLPNAFTESIKLKGHIYIIFQTSCIEIHTKI